MRDFSLELVLQDESEQRGSDRIQSDKKNLKQKLLSDFQNSVMELQDRLEFNDFSRFSKTNRSKELRRRKSRGFSRFSDS